MFGFKALFEAWRGPGLVAKMFDEFEEMLSLVLEMFTVAREACAGAADSEGARARLRTTDKEVNRLQRSIRRQIVEHLIANPGTDVPACLVLMSIVKDAERLGDYTKALFDAALMACPAVRGGEHAPEVREMETMVAGMMTDAKKALADSDEALANDIMSREDAVKARCNSVIARLAGENLDGATTVTLTLMAQYLRRLASHTANIASSVTNPVEWLDYKSKMPT